MKYLLPLFILVMLASCSVNSRGGYRGLPPLENRSSRQIYWQKERSHGNTSSKKNLVMAYHKTAENKAQ